MSDDLHELYEKGSELYEKGDYDASEMILKQVIAGRPYYADVLNKLGVIANLRGRLEEAAAYLERAIEINPKYTEAALNLTITYNEMGDTEKASKVFKNTALSTFSEPEKLDPYVSGKLANEHFKLGNIYHEMGMLDEAIEQYNRAIELKPGLPDIHTKLGVILREKKDYDGAISELTRAKAANPYYGPAYVHLGLTYYAKGLTGMAFEEWEAALVRIPGLKEAQSLLAVFKDKGQAGA